MTTPTVQAELKATGVAQVIVMLKTAVRPVGAEAAAARASGVSTSAAGIEHFFTTSERSQVSALMRSAALKAGRKTRRGRASTGLESLAAGGQAPPKVRVYPNLGLMLGVVDRAGLKALNADDRVAAVTSAAPISLIRPVAARAAALSGDVTWGLKRLGVPDLWAQGVTGKDVLVGHLDTGVDGKHPALKKAIKEFAEFDLVGNRVEGAKPHDTEDHGTHTAGTIAGRKVTDTSFGVAPGALLASAIVIEGGDVIARILGGMDWAVGLGVRVLSMSLGLRGFHEDFLPLTQVLRARNVLPVFAVGNEGPGTSRSPGNYAEALSVGACDEDDLVADFSSSQEFRRTTDKVVPDLVAPGVGVISCVPGGGFAEMDGSSMATPHIAGLAALLFEAGPHGDGRPGRAGDLRLVRAPRRDAGRPREPGGSQRDQGADYTTGGERRGGLPRADTPGTAGPPAEAAPEEGQEEDITPGEGTSMAGAKVDPELIKQLDAAAAGTGPVAAVFTLKAGEGQKFLPPEEVEAAVGRAMKRAEKESGATPHRLNVFKNLGTFMISAPPALVRSLLDQDEIATASAKPAQPDEVLIRPVHKHPVDAPEPGPRKPKRKQKDRGES
ncbi:MAG: S8 family serine peptidase [Isosphaeraceae bacterium]